MKLKLIIGLSFMIWQSLVISQNNESDISLYYIVDSLIRFELNYTFDSTSNQMPKRTWNPEKHKGMYPAFSSLPQNPAPLILMNGDVIELEDLKNISSGDLSQIKIFPQNDTIAMTLYGFRGKNGLVIIKTKSSG